jgi:hypothetical protein
MSNPFEISAPQPTANAPPARGMANPFETQVRDGRARCARTRCASSRGAMDDDARAVKR